MLIDACLSSLCLTTEVLSSGWPGANPVPSDARNSANIENYPYHVSVEFPETPRVSCAGAIISKKHVITTANCVKYKSLDAIRIRAWYTTTRLKGGTVYEVENVTAHEDYKFIDGWRINDTYSKLFGAGEVASAGSPANVIGWGGNDELPQLRVANEIRDYSTCDRAYNEAHGIPSKTICAGMGACYNDPGDPIVVGGLVAGVATNHVTDCEMSFAGSGVFSEIARYRDWIDRYVEYSDCKKGK
ncbi:hypothetical protein QAD02_023962 [Eretmocerus hayati]|uniref:Uncharacterized protein n=1 Tax=Eretmocerus hayati TaxID=131215 RepID=A0ACC2Q0T2_9HYME|nr:hypothetical protein QAD02_023962 [Eretmocerus hayati]